MDVEKTVKFLIFLYWKIFTFHISMDQVAEELVANDVHGNADLQAKGYDPSTLEPRNALGSPIMCASMRSDWAESSTTDYMDTSRMEEKGLK
ncbi:hypothetical protein NC652_032972 [Populus alba x Populus x berolinensis]|nr:hypothetical protein NC652_032972 [Populus alba x Populus x berolinensis]